MSVPSARPSPPHPWRAVALVGAAWTGVLSGLLVGAPPRPHDGAAWAPRQAAPASPAAPTPPERGPSGAAPSAAEAGAPEAASVEAARAALHGLQLSPWRTPDGREGELTSTPLVWATLTPPDGSDAPHGADPRHVVLLRILAHRVEARLLLPDEEEAAGPERGGPRDRPPIDARRLLAAIDLGDAAALGGRDDLPDQPPWRRRGALWIEAGRARVGTPPPTTTPVVLGAREGSTAARAVVVVASDPAGDLLIICGLGVEATALVGLAARLGAPNVAVFEGPPRPSGEAGLGDLYFWSGGSDDARLLRRPLGRDGRPRPARALRLDRPKLLLSLLAPDGRPLHDTR